MRKFFVLFIIFYILTFCKSSNIDLVGEYKSEKSSLINKLNRTLNDEGWLVGSELILNKDSTFTRSTCDFILKGNWFVLDDSLYLKTLKNINKKDTTLQVSYQVTKDFKASYVYFRGNNFLLRKGKSTSGKIFTEKLIRIK